jgi:hypothetical protein
MNCRTRRCSSKLDLQALLERAVPVLQACAAAAAGARDLALVVRDDVAHDALMASLRADPAGSDPQRDPVRCLQAGKATGTGIAPSANAAWPCGWNCSTSTAH